MSLRSVGLSTRKRSVALTFSGLGSSRATSTGIIQLGRLHALLRISCCSSDVTAQATPQDSKFPREAMELGMAEVTSPSIRNANGNARSASASDPNASVTTPTVTMSDLLSIPTTPIVTMTVPASIRKSQTGNNCAPIARRTNQNASSFALVGRRKNPNSIPRCQTDCATNPKIRNATPTDRIWNKFVRPAVNQTNRHANAFAPAVKATVPLVSTCAPNAIPTHRIASWTCHSQKPCAPNACNWMLDSTESRPHRAHASLPRTAAGPDDRRDDTKQTRPANRRATGAEDSYPTGAGNPRDCQDCDDEADALVALEERAGRRSGLN